MSSLTQLRLAAREIFNESLRAVDAGAAVRKSMSFDDRLLTIGETTIDLDRRGIEVVALGKAAHAMGAAVQTVLGQALQAGVISALPSAHRLDSRWQVFAGGHPVPNDESLRAASAAIALVERANTERAVMIFLISGGGSAMLELPADKTISLHDLRVANRVLVHSGSSIGEINSVRRAFSAVKGGKLSAFAPDCDQFTLIVSDVPAGEESSVASGPTLPPPANAPAAREVIDRYNLRNQLPASVLGAVESGQPPHVERAHQLREHLVLVNNQTALKAAANAARARGFIAEIAEEISDQPIEAGSELLLKRLNTLRQKAEANSNVCLISGGEFACPVRGEGIGGRNLETALRLAHSGPALEFVAVCAGTDGIDGNSPAAGAIVDSTTIKRANSIGLNAEDFLQRSDAYSFFVALGDVVNTGPTGTNVRDMRILLA